MHIEVPFSGLSFESMMLRIAWERLLASFMFVAPVARNAAPFDTAASSAAAEPVKTATVISVCPEPGVANDRFLSMRTMASCKRRISHRQEGSLPRVQT
jgi:hypothetical protein